VHLGSHEGPSKLGSLDPTDKHLVQTRLVKSDHDLPAGGNDRNGSCSRDLGHLFKSRLVCRDIVVGIGDSLLRKILFRHLAVGSRRARVDLDLLFHTTPSVMSVLIKA